MIYILYGQDSFRSRQKLREIIAEYQKKNEGTLDLHRFDAETDDPREIAEAGKSQSLFQKKKLVVIERPSVNWEKLARVLKPVLKDWAEDKNVFVIFWDNAAGKDFNAFLKVVEPHAEKTQEYKQMSPGEVLRWFSEYIKDRKLGLSAENARELLAKYSQDTWQLVNEAEKVALGGEMAEPLFLADEKIFRFIDAALVDQISALKELTNLRNRGIDDYYLYAALVNHVRTLLAVADGDTPSGIHPFVLQKARAKTRRLSREYLKSVYTKLFFEDAKTKIGVSDPYASLVSIILS
ncbi:MAG: hypothetical protein HYT39_01310 [Candidatus Sungbacteria bacterium]|nr:hypothetical protein [Candidatus Sungbacteria bacterium]